MTFSEKMFCKQSLCFVNKTSAACSRNNCDVFHCFSKSIQYVAHGNATYSTCQAVDLIQVTKLSHYGIRGVALDWFRSYISERKQFTTFKSTDSVGFLRGRYWVHYLYKRSTNAPTFSKCIFFRRRYNYILLIRKPSYFVDLNEQSEWFKANKL